jgi:hypothetical protein
MERRLQEQERHLARPGDPTTNTGRLVPVCLRKLRRRFGVATFILGYLGSLPSSAEPGREDTET